MIGEYFLDICLTACCSVDNNSKQATEIFDSMANCIEVYKKSILKQDIVLDFKEKLDLVFILCDIKRKRPSITYEEIYNKIESTKLSKFIPLMETKKTKLTNIETENILSVINNKRKLVHLLEGKNNLVKLLNDIDLGNYDNEDIIIQSWDKTVEELHSKVIDCKKSESLNKVSSLNLLDDPLDGVISKIRRNVNNENTIKSGFKYITDNFTAKGYERGRYYLIGGCSGVGKSTFLINEIKSAIVNKVTKKERAYLYITAENLIDETWCRFYCCLTGKPYEELILDINNKHDELEKDYISLEDPDYIKQVQKIYEYYQVEVQKILKVHNANIIFKYTQPGFTTTKDIEILIQEVKEKYSERFEAVYIDYLDLFSTGMNLDLRLELGVISRAFKTLSIVYDIVVISATQLNREAYDIKISPKLTQMGESMLKVNEADFVLFLQQSTENQEEQRTTCNGEELLTQVRMTILKNRAGSTATTHLIKLIKKINGISTFNYRFEEIIGVDNSINNLMETNNFGFSDDQDK